jgi:lipopolysaccharide/colanic/teichoic acid biosynthesis glycosyltransferase
MYLRYGKRIFDFTVALVALPLLLLPGLAIAVAVWAGSGRPVFFRQGRVGRGGRVFRILKFRTMVVRPAGDSTVTVAGDARMTPIGGFLRRWKLDEFPQLWNVLLGDMSLVGPRPDVPGYADRLEGEARRVLELRPGITGPATLAYRNEEEILAQVEDPVRYNDEVVWPEKVRLNLEYLDTASLGQDLGYLWRTAVGK